MSNLSEYTEISAFNADTTLVRRDNSVYVKKCVPKKLAYIYKILLENRHKNISDIIEVFEYEDCAVIIEEYIDGETLAGILSKRGTLTEAETKSIIAQICDGTLFLHKHKIIHRDINPSNIMLTRDNRVKIIDFDISRRVKKDAPNDTVILGTAGYAAPEQFGFKQSDTRTDMYAIGVLANVMLTGDMPNVRLYGGKIGRVIKKATSIDAAARYGSITEFKHAFTNEVDENTPPAMRALRSIPGFRTWTPWKMLFASVMYIIWIPELMLYLYWSLGSVRDFAQMLTGEIFLAVIPYRLITNIKPSGNPKKAVLKAALWAFVSFSAGACIIAPVLEKFL